MVAAMAEERTGPGGAEEGAGDAPARRPRVRVLVGFLIVFLLLLIAFRAVLFPFLMAMFIAYLIEPLVAAITRSRLFGLRWTRGPTIVLLYAVLLVGLVMLSSCAVTNVAGKVKDLSRDVAAGLSATAQRAHFALEAPPPPADGEAPRRRERDLRIPAGTRVALRLPEAGTEGEEPRPLEVFATLYDVVLSPDEMEKEVLVEPTDEEVGADGGPRILDLDGIRYLDDAEVPGLVSRLGVRIGESAAGLEVFAERKLITPIVKNLEKAGYRVDPTEIRALLAAQAKGLGENLPQKVTSWGRDVIGRLALSIYEFILVLMLTAFIVMDRKTIAEFFASLPPVSVRREYHTLLRYVDDGLAGVIRGQLVVCGVNGVLTYAGLLVIGVPGAWILALIAGILSLIPIFGTILSTIPIVLVAAADGLDKGLFALGWVMVIHLVEANLLNPLIMGSHARMHPVIIIFALLAGEHAYGVWGALLAVPTASILQSCFLFYRHEIEGIPRPPPEPHAMRRLLGRIFHRSPPEKTTGSRAG